MTKPFSMTYSSSQESPAKKPLKQKWESITLEDHILSLRGVNHTALRVKDVRKAYKFYHETLNLPIDRIIGSESSPRVVFLQGLELSQARPEQGPAGFSHLGLVVERIEEVYEDLKKKGIVFEGSVRDVRFEDERKAVKVAFFTDPDGNRVELVEWRDI